VELLQQKQMVLLVPAEGTRQAVKKWRTGFYHIARKAGTPISLGTLDYQTKEADVLGYLLPGDNFEADMHFIQEKYRHVHPKHPENYHPEIY